MRIMLKICIIYLIFKLVACLSRLNPRLKQIKTKAMKNEDSIGLSKVVQYILDAQFRSGNRRSVNHERLDKAKNVNNILRQKEMPDHQALVEKELKIALTHKKSALHDRPYIEKKGKNDFLVIHPEVIDPFVTVVPNHIYYNIEKSCVNWLDDCSLIGLRERLLKGSQA